MTAIAPQDPAWSAKEIERGQALGFKAVIHNGHVGGEYTDAEKYWPIFAPGWISIPVREWAHSVIIRGMKGIVSSWRM